MKIELIFFILRLYHIYIILVEEKYKDVYQHIYNSKRTVSSENEPDPIKDKPISCDCLSNVFSKHGVAWLEFKVVANMLTVNGNRVIKIM